MAMRFSFCFPHAVKVMDLEGLRSPTIGCEMFFSCNLMFPTNQLKRNHSLPSYFCVCKYLACVLWRCYMSDTSFSFDDFKWRDEVLSFNGESAVKIDSF